MLFKIFAENGIRPNIVLEKDENEQVAKEINGEDNEVDKDKSAQASALSL